MRTFRGTTIVELLVYIGLLSIFLVVLLQVFVTTLNFKLQSESTSSLNQDARYILSKISFDVYNADSFTVPSASELDIVSGGVTHKYMLNSGNLTLDSLNLNSLDTTTDSIVFMKIDNTVQIKLTLKSQIIIKNSQETLSFQETVGPR